MFTDMLEGLILVLSPQSIILMFLGVLVGIIFGAIPGLTGSIAIAILLPVTFYLDPVPALALLAGVYVGGSYGGSIAAILFGTPGSPEAGITVFDGHPLAKKGQSGKALSISLYSSAAANFLSSVSMIVLAVWIAKFAIKIGPAEYFAIILFSLVLIATIGSKGSWIKGILSVVIGLFFGLIGGDPITGAPRFSFGLLELTSAIPLIPVLVGLFIGVEILHNVGRKFEKKSTTLAEHKEKNSLTPQEIKKCVPYILSGSIIGTIIGALPGLNAAISATLNYSLAKKLSKDGDKFGTGVIEGIAAPEAANNGTVGPTLVPLLTLGIPGSGTAAIFLGALLMQGVIPGPAIFKESGPIVYGLCFALILCTIVLLIMGKIVNSGAQYITLIPMEIVYPVIILFCVAGAFTVNNRTFDILILLFFMLLGYLMQIAKIPVLPLLIAFLLGDLMERSFRQSLLIFKGDFTKYLNSPICVAFLLITVSLILYAAFEQNIRHILKIKDRGSINNEHQFD